VRNLIDNYYHNTPDGIPGNDDTGTLSCWLLYSMLGIYPHCPGDMEYAISSPVFDEVEIKLNQDYYPGESIFIKSKNNDNGQNIYIDKLKWNGKLHKSFFIDHQSLVEGGKLSFTLKENK